MKKLFTREILIGLILIISLSVLFVGIDFLKGVNVFQPASMYYVSFSDVTGLTEASPVTLNGLKVGQVTGISYNSENPGQIAVEVRLDKEIKLTRGSEFLLSTGLLGTAGLSIKMAPGTDFYDTGEMVPGVKPDDLMAEITSGVMPELVKILPRLNSILENIDTLVANPALEKTVVRLDAISRNVEQTTARLAKICAEVEPAAGNVDKLTENLAVVSSDLKELSAELKTLPIRETMENVKATSDNLSEITAQINGKDSTLGLLLNDDGLYNHIDSTVKSLDSVLIDLRKNPKKYVNFKLF